MSGTPSPPPACYRPAEVAQRLRCSEWWLKEQARHRRIPYSWIGGSYRFTDDHIADIIRRFEVKPTDDIQPVTSARPARQPATPDAGSEPAVVLVARVPRRMRQTATDTRSAA